MKTKYIFLLVYILSCKILFAQSKVCYTYDKAGNRTNRTICLKSKEATSDSVSIAKIPITENMGEMLITLYPNPTKGQLTIQITNITCETEGALELYDLSGRLVIVQKTVGESTMLDISRYPLGIYLMRIRICDKVSEWRIIKE